MKELEVQKYLRSGKSLINLKQEYKIDFTVNTEQNKALVALAQPFPCTFHRAFDQIVDSTHRN